MSDIGTQSRRGKKPATPSFVVKEEANAAKIISSSNTPIRKTRAAFRGKLSHTSPILDSLPRENKITVYFGTKNDDGPNTNCEVEGSNDVEITKSMALKMVFGKSKYFKFWLAIVITFDFSDYKFMNLCDEEVFWWSDIGVLIYFEYFWSEYDRFNLLSD